MSPNISRLLILQQIARNMLYSRVINSYPFKHEIESMLLTASEKCVLTALLLLS